MIYHFRVFLNSILFLSVGIISTSIVLAQQQGINGLIEKDESAGYYLQEGHRAKRNGDIEYAIKLYTKALEVDPDYSAAKYSLEPAMRMLELKKWATQNLTEECRTGQQSSSYKCADDYFSFNGQPIHPKIIKALSTWISDSGDQIVAININDSQHSNIFCCDSDIRLRDQTIYYKEEDEEYGYTYIGKTESGVHVLHAYDWSGGSGVFANTILLVIETDYGVAFENSVIKANRPRLLIKKLGEIALGDRWSGELKVKGNSLTIGEDQGRFAGTGNGGQFSEIPKDRVIEIDISP